MQVTASVSSFQTPEPSCYGLCYQAPSWPSSIPDLLTREAPDVSGAHRSRVWSAPEQVPRGSWLLGPSFPCGLSAKRLLTSCGCRMAMVLEVTFLATSGHPAGRRSCSLVHLGSSRLGRPDLSAACHRLRRGEPQSCGVWREGRAIPPGHRDSLHVDKRRPGTWACEAALLPGVAETQSQGTLGGDLVIQNPHSRHWHLGQEGPAQQRAGLRGPLAEKSDPRFLSPVTGFAACPFVHPSPGSEQGEDNPCPQSPRHSWLPKA